MHQMEPLVSQMPWMLTEGVCAHDHRSHLTTNKLHSGLAREHTHAQEQIALQLFLPMTSITAVHVPFRFNFFSAVAA